MSLGDVAADDDHAGLKKLTVPARTSPSVRPARARSGSRPRAAAHERTTSRLLGASTPAAASRSASAWPPAIGLEAADVAAAADDVLVAGRADVADVAGRAVRAAVDVAVGDDAAADAGADLDEEQVLGSRQCVRCSPRAMMLTSLSTSTGAP